MKKTLFMMFVCVFSLTTYAQTYKLGDLIEKDGIKALVVYVDESGEHGLMLSPSAYLGDECLDEPETTGVVASLERAKSHAKGAFSRDTMVTHYRIKKACKKTGEDHNALYEKRLQNKSDSLNAQLELLDMVAQMPRLTCSVGHNDDKEWKKMYQNILSTNGEYGKENTHAILDYCIKNDISMQDYFPAYYWVTQLGQDWFIPGAHELELIGVQFVGDLGAGIKHMHSRGGLSKKAREIIKHREELESAWYHNWNYVPAIYPLKTMSRPMLIESSTLSKSAWAENKENKEKITIPLGGGWGFLSDSSFLGFLYGWSEEYGDQSYFVKETTNIKGRCCAMAEF